MERRSRIYLMCQWLAGGKLALLSSQRTAQGQSRTTGFSPCALALPNLWWKGHPLTKAIARSGVGVTGEVIAAIFPPPGLAAPRCSRATPALLPTFGGYLKGEVQRWGLFCGRVPHALPIDTHFLERVVYQMRVV